MNNNQNELFAAPEKISGVVERVTFQSPDTGFCVLKVKAEGHGQLVTIVGNAPDINPGEWVQAEGQWVQDTRFGPQLKAARLNTAPPGTVEGMRRYLGSGLVKGIGPGFADRLVEAFGKDVFNVIENEPRRLREVAGIGAGRARQITEAWQQQQQVRGIMVFLHSHGVGTGRAFRIYKQYGQDSIRVLQDDPYCLARDIHGFGFKLADQVAVNLGIAGDSPLRVRAGVEHVLQELTSQGHCAYPRTGLIDRAAELLGVPAGAVTAAVESGVAAGRLVAVGSVAGHEDLVALTRLQRAERELAEDLIRLASQQPSNPVTDTAAALAWVEKETGLQLADGQKQAVVKALQHRVLVITGGPGVGKTTLLNSILKIHRARKKKVVACAPTGRAARRLAESTGETAKTIHRLLEFNPANGGFRHDRAHPLKGDVFVVDEFSMVDTVLAWQLIGALPPGATLLIVGDRDQLPSVGAGRVLADLIESRRLPVAILDEVFRQAARSAIVTNAHRINGGQLPVTPEGDDPGDFYFIEREGPQAIEDLVVELTARRLPRHLRVDPVADIQVLTPMRRGNLGTEHLNRRLQAELNPTGESVQRMGVIWRVGDRVMQTVNNYDKDVFNGDAGVIQTLDVAEGELVIRFEDRVCAYTVPELDELVHSYAATIHKSQGSEYPVVVIPLHSQQYVLLQRNLLYTGVTRGRRLVVLVGSRQAVARAVKTQDSRQRVTTLAHWLGSSAG
jgi:exodeoxyribonuclease V alpha subunit